MALKGPLVSNRTPWGRIRCQASDIETLKLTIFKLEALEKDLAMSFLLLPISQYSVT